jgi:hypothetical protein
VGRSDRMINKLDIVPALPPLEDFRCWDLVCVTSLLYCGISGLLVDGRRFAQRAV